MGKMILCSGRRTKRPYLFSTTGIRVYSIEELCYYIWHNISFVDVEMFSEELLDWIEVELSLPQSAEKLRNLKKNNADLKTLVTSLLCSADYYGEKEIKSILKTVDEMEDYHPAKKNFIRANHYLKRKQYAEAINEYERILSSEDAIGLPPKDYGDVLHNLAVAKVNTQGFLEASEIFYHAYERNGREESLRQYLYSLKMTGEEVYNKKVEEYKLEDETRKDIEEELQLIQEEALESPGIEQINRIKQLKAQGMVTEYKQMVQEMIDNWISSYRKGI